METLLSVLKDVAVSLLTFILGYSARTIRQRYLLGPFRAFWTELAGTTGRLLFVVATHESAGTTQVVHKRVELSVALALGEVRSSLGQWLPEIDVQLVDGREANADLLLGGLVLVGAGDGNPLTADFLRRLGDPVEVRAGTEVPLRGIDTRDGNRYRCQVDPKGDLTTDFGAVVLGPNPLNPIGRACLIVASYAQGTAGTLRTLLPGSLRKLPRDTGLRCPKQTTVAIASVPVLGPWAGDGILIASQPRPPAAD